MEQQFNLLYVVEIIRKYFWYIAALIVVAGLVAVIGTTPFFYPPEFRSSTVIYPTSPERFDIINLFAEEPRVFVYGDSKEVEKLDNLAHADEFQLMIIDSMDLWSEYGVNLHADASPKYEALRVYNSRISIIRIAGNGLSIEALDTDPQRAADIVNLIVRKINEWNKRMLTQNRSHIAELYQHSLQELQAQLSSYKDSAQKVRIRYNILHSETQTEVLVDRILQTQIRFNNEQAKLNAYQKIYSSRDSALVNTKARVTGLRKSLIALNSANGQSAFSLPSFREGYDEIRSLEEVYIRLSASVKETTEKIKYLQMLNKSEINTIMVMGEAQPSDKKAKPIRWLILAATLIITALSAIIGVVLIDLLIHKMKTPAPNS